MSTPPLRDEPHERPPAVPRFRDGTVYPLFVFVCVRVVISICGVVFVSEQPPNPSVVGPGAPPARYTEPATPGLHNALDGMQRWDAAWFRWIADEGYGTDDARAAFLPGYPLLIALTSLATPLDHAASATLVSNIAFALSLIVLFALTRFERPDDRTAWRSVALFASLPTSFFFLALFSEAPFLLATLLAFYWARTGRWGWRVAASGFAACLIRSMGVAVVIALVVEALRHRSSNGPRRSARLGAAAAGLVAPMAYGLWWWTRGAPLRPIRAQAYWDRELTFPLVALADGLSAGWRAVTSGAPWLVVDAVLVTIALFAAVGAWRRLAGSYATYVWISLAIPLSYAVPWRPLLSVPRLAAVLFPASWVGVEVIRARASFAMLVAASLALQIALAVRFMNWGWIW